MAFCASLPAIRLSEEQRRISLATEQVGRIPGARLISWRQVLRIGDKSLSHVLSCTAALDLDGVPCTVTLYRGNTERHVLEADFTALQCFHRGGDALWITAAGVRDIRQRMLRITHPLTPLETLAGAAPLVKRLRMHLDDASLALLLTVLEESGCSAREVRKLLSTLSPDQAEWVRRHV